MGKKFFGGVLNASEIGGKEGESDINKQLGVQTE